MAINDVAAPSIFDCGVGPMAHKGVLQPYLPFVLRIAGFWGLRSTGDPPHNRRWGSVLMHGRCRMPLCGEFSGCNPPYRHLAHLPGLQFDILHAGTLPHEQCERFDFLASFAGFWGLRSTGDPPHNRRWGSVLMHGRCRMPLCGEFSGCNPPYRHLAHLPRLQFDIPHAGTLPYEQGERFDFLASFVDEAGHAGADD